MPGRGHGRQTLPLAGSRIERFRIVEGARASHERLAAEHEHAPPRLHHRHPTTAGWKGRTAGPGARSGIVNLVRGQLHVTTHAAGQHMYATVHRGGAMMVASRRHRRATLPAVRARIVNLMRPHRAILPRSRVVVVVDVRPVGDRATDGMNTPVMHGHGKRSPRRRHGRTLAPLTGGNVIDAHRADGIERVGPISADYVEATVDISETGVVHAFGDLADRPPAVRLRIVSVHVARRGSTFTLALRCRETAQHVDHSPICGGGNLGARLWYRCTRLPL